MIAWTDSVRTSGKLVIKVSQLAGSWGHVFRQALREFNNLSSAHKLGVSIVEPKQTDKAEPNLTVQTASGPVSASYDGQTRSGQFDGGRLHGQTLLFWRDPENVVEKGFIYLPSEPLVNTPSGQRPVGAGVMTVIAVHELLHACGLDNDDHSTDLFQANPQVDYGDTPAADRVLIGRGPKGMPPLILDGATAKKVRDLWAK
ncbi:MAG TPA: hypothetical protein VKR43_19585 [Bryobacteraceae bacterium]|jgi:hypothetical protein|nr:hypothetical protein [Bryobacteraceae bacterium]